jgi:hypothetical protein
MRGVKMENDTKKAIDTTYDFRTDSKNRDPDIYSATLRRYHKILWTKTLPNGDLFILDDALKKDYLCYESNFNKICLSSDVITHTYSRWKRMQHLIEQVPKNEIDDFRYVGCTIGAHIIFPKNKINGMQTINQKRGSDKKINDRFDLTLECIRCHYDRRENPLQKTLEAYGDYFELFQNFKGFCDFFLLQDLVSEDYKKIKFFLPFNGFVQNPLPTSVDEYLIYKNNSVEFVRKRNNRIQMLNK